MRGAAEPRSEKGCNGMPGQTQRKGNEIQRTFHLFATSCGTRCLPVGPPVIGTGTNFMPRVLMKGLSFVAMVDEGSAGAADAAGVALSAV